MQYIYYTRWMTVISSDDRRKKKRKKRDEFPSALNDDTAMLSGIEYISKYNK